MEAVAADALLFSLSAGIQQHRKCRYCQAVRSAERGGPLQADSTDSGEQTCLLSLCCLHHPSVSCDVSGRKGDRERQWPGKVRFGFGMSVAGLEPATSPEITDECAHH